MKNKETGEIKDFIMSFSEREEFLKSGEWTQILSAPLIVSGVKTALRQTDEGWKDTLRNIKAGSGRGSTINV